jgi:ArsR family transcriptional regulator
MASVPMALAPKQKRPAGEPCCEPVVYPDVLRKHAGKVCVCELVPLFDLSQPTVSHHLKVLRDAGIVDSERQGLWAYYYVVPGALDELSAWLS